MAYKEYYKKFSPYRELLLATHAALKMAAQAATVGSEIARIYLKSGPSTRILIKKARPATFKTRYGRRPATGRRRATASAAVRLMASPAVRLTASPAVNLASVAVALGRGWGRTHGAVHLRNARKVRRVPGRPAARPVGKRKGNSGAQAVRNAISRLRAAQRDLFNLKTEVESLRAQRG